MYKDCFKLMDINKDGTLDKNDLRGAFDNIGVLMSESELDDLMGEVGGPCNVMGMINMFQEKMAGDGNDPSPASWTALDSSSAVESPLRGFLEFNGNRISLDLNSFRRWLFSCRDSTLLFLRPM